MFERDRERKQAQWWEGRSMEEVRPVSLMTRMMLYFCLVAFVLAELDACNFTESGSLERWSRC